MRFHNNRGSSKGQTARKAGALDEIALALARHLRAGDDRREELVSRLVRIIEARTNYVFLEREPAQGRDAAFHMTAGERPDSSADVAASPALQKFQLR